MLTDAHTHLHLNDETDFEKLIENETLVAIINASSVSHYNHLSSRFLSHINENRVFISYGVHPWEVTGELTGEQIKLLEKAAIIGEIGMDSVWSQVPLVLQRKTFIKQLEIALELNKPIILHTKGSENEIAAILEEYKKTGYDNNIAVHWYSGPEDALKRLSELDCYFTLAIDVASNPAQKKVARSVSLDRILIESDGIEGASWALGKDIGMAEIPCLLDTIIKEAAEIQNLESEVIKDTTYKNFLHFVHHC